MIQSPSLVNPKKDFVKQLQFGLQGETALQEFLERRGASVLNLNYVSPCDTCYNKQDWKRYVVLPDFLVKNNDLIYFADAKARSSRRFFVEVRNYHHYITLMAIMPVKIFFLIYDKNKENLLEMYIHGVNLDVSNYDIETYYDGNKIYNIDGFVNKVEL